MITRDMGEPEQTSVVTQSTLDRLAYGIFNIRLRIGNETTRRKGLHHAVWGNRLERVQKILQDGLDISRDVHLLSQAVVHASTDVLQLLLAHDGLRSNVTGLHHCQALDIAVWKGDLPAVRVLLENGVNFKTKNCYDETVLYVAACGNCDSIAKHLIDMGSDMNETTRGWAPIHVATQRTHVEVQQVLIQEGCNVNLRETNEQRSPIEIALWSECEQSVQNLIWAGCELKKSSLNQYAFQKRPELEDIIRRERERVKKLSEICRKVIRSSMGQQISLKSESLSLPKLLKDFICMREYFKQTSGTTKFNKLPYKWRKKVMVLGACSRVQRKGQLPVQIPQVDPV